MRQRLIARGDTSPEAIENRVAIALREIEQSKTIPWNFQLVNDNLDVAYEELCAFLKVKNQDTMATLSA
jgi:guanylate kinase